MTGYILTDGVEVVDGKNEITGELVWISMDAQIGRDAFISRDVAARYGDRWGVNWSEVYIKEIHADINGRWTL